MSPIEAISALDRALEEDGEDAILRRVIGTGTNSRNIDAPVLAFVRPVKAEDIVGAISQGDLAVTISPTDIDAAQWPGGLPETTSAYAPDPRIPRVTDKIVVQNRVRDIKFPKPLLVGGELVRIDLVASG